MADLFENIAPSWVTNHLYQLGDVVLYNKKLYQCTDKHTSSSDIDLDKFKPHTLADMVAGTTQLENFADMTVISDVVTNDDTYTYLEMPNNGVVSDKTKIATLNSNLGSKEELEFSKKGSNNHSWQRNGYTWDYNFSNNNEKLFLLRIKATYTNWLSVQTKLDGVIKYTNYFESGSGVGYISIILTIPSGTHNVQIYAEETYGAYFEKDFGYLISI